MKSICFIVHNINGSGGDTRVATTIINGLVKTIDCKITVFSIESAKKYRKNTFHLDPKVNIVYVTEKINNLKKEIIPLSLRIKEYIKNERFDVLVVSGMDFVPFVLPSFNHLKNTKKIAWDHMNYKVGHITSLLGIGRRIAIKSFDRIVVLTDRDKTTYLASDRNLENKVVRIYNPIDIVGTERLNYDSSIKKIVSCGLLVEQKGFDYAIQIASRLAKRHPDWSWDIWGDGPLRSTLENMIKVNGLEGYVQLKGYTDNMLEKYNNYSIFALTSRFEGFGMVLAEALKYGIPSVSFDIDAGPSEMIENNINGFLVPSFNIQAFANSLSELMIHSEKRILFSQYAHNRIAQMDSSTAIHSWGKLITD